MDKKIQDIANDLSMVIAERRKAQREKQGYFDTDDLDINLCFLEGALQLLNKVDTKGYKAIEYNDGEDLQNKLDIEQKNYVDQLLYYYMDTNINFEEMFKLYDAIVEMTKGNVNKYFKKHYSKFTEMFDAFWSCHKLLLKTFKITSLRDTIERIERQAEMEMAEYED